MNDEIERWRAAGEPDPFTMSRDRLTRKDVWLALDWIEEQLLASDRILDSAVRKRFTNLRAMLATMLPADRPRLDCPYADCNCYADTAAQLAEHIASCHPDRPLHLSAVP